MLAGRGAAEKTGRNTDPYDNTMTSTMLLGLLACLLGSIFLLLMISRGLVCLRTKSRRIGIVVGGDVGRSPRMQNHALSLANDGWEVELFGYSETPLKAAVSAHPAISLRVLPTPWRLPRSPKLLYIACIIPAALGRTMSLLYALLGGGNKSVFLVQNPPSIPTLLVVRFASYFWYGAALVIDWHNYGYTIMETTGAPNIAVKIAKLYEKCLGPTGDAHFCVAKSMRRDLDENWGIPGASVLYDKAPASFGPTPAEEAKALHGRLEALGATTMSDFYSSEGSLREDRPALVISSTSWTPDEDFDLFLEALKLVEQELPDRGGKKMIQVVITGKGPTKAAFEASVAKAKLVKIAVSTAFLTAEDYPKLLGAADFGVSLHYSSSGLDLPMKVVDMFGTGLPVCQVDYKCIDELVQHRKNGFIFKDAKELSSNIQELLQDFPEKKGVLGQMKGHLEVFRARKWEQEWAEVAASVFDSLGGDKKAQ